MTFFWLTLTMVILLNISGTVFGFGIIGGKPSRLYPFFVRVRRDQFVCGGTIVAENAILTAAHCLFNRRLSRWSFFKEVHVEDADFTQPDWDQNVEKFECNHYKIHRKFDSFFYGSSYDIAIIILQENIDFSKSHNAVLEPCKIPVVFEGSFYKYGTAIGMGLTQQRPKEVPKILMEAVLRRDRNCGKYGEQEIEESIQICYSIPGNSSICHGDSGGPLVHKENGEAVCLIGISSFTDNDCTDPRYPGVFTAAGSFRDWIERNSKSFEIRRIN